MKIRAGGGALGQEGTPEKTCLVPYANSRSACATVQSDQHNFVVRCLDSIILTRILAKV